MASGTVVGEGKDGENRERQRYMENKVYTRKAFKGPKKSNLLDTTTNNVNTTKDGNEGNNINTTKDGNEGNNKNNINTTKDGNEGNNNNKNINFTKDGNEGNNNINTTQDGNEGNNNDNSIIINKEDNNNNINNKEDNNNGNNNEYNKIGSTVVNNSVFTTIAAPIIVHNEDNTNDKNNSNDDNKNNSAEAPTQPPPLEHRDSSHQQPAPHVDTAVSNDSSSLKKQKAVTDNGALKPGSENRVKVNLASRSKQQMWELRRKLESELDLVRNLVKRIEAKEAQISNSHVTMNDGADYRFKRVQPEVTPVGIPQEPVKQNRPLNQLNIPVLENSQGVSENIEKEKRTPKANQFYRNSEFLLAKDKFPPAESNKKLKLNAKKHGGGELNCGFGMGNKCFKSCISLLERLMKHKHGWVFNAPVDVKGLGLHDYYSIIKHPMDLGTVKSRLNKNWYKSPREFAEDVRLTFRNAMTYNPKGQDVHIMAEELSQIFEDKWAAIEADYIRDMRLAMEYEASLPMPTPRKAPPMLPPPLDMRRILDRPKSMMGLDDLRPKRTATTPSGRIPTPKKPKAKDPCKRDMTYEEKQKLSTNLQSLPSEKLDNIVQIIRKRNSDLFQHDDEIEVDIDSVDTETLWELDRFITNYKKSLSKNKRKVELAIQARAKAGQTVQENNPTPALVEVPKEATTNEQNMFASTVEVEKRGDNASRSSSSSSSSSDFGSSSSDSDTESSSASKSDAGHSSRS
ncbi:transcription factor GTE4-like isoform X2 [Hibiscus syriacus]|uniref:transcription factor GTE4-like isoform X2 n=1 Tax=Hibiscus syriacus TaxID=106335 RepID=UPI001920A793|nr:transcription factor GTE4-like isoform X2 [Hibiscus syriacus]